MSFFDWMIKSLDSSEDIIDSYFVETSLVDCKMPTPIQQAEYSGYDSLAMEAVEQNATDS